MLSKTRLIMKPHNTAERILINRLRTIWTAEYQQIQQQRAAELERFKERNKAIRERETAAK